MNDNDTEIMSGILEAKGMRRVADAADADVVMVNTCVVREGAEDRAVARLQSLISHKRARPHMVVGMAGCMAQRDGERVLEKLPFLDLVVGTRDLFKIGNLVDEVSRTGERVVAVQDVDKPVFLDAQPVRRKHAIKAHVTIMYGCNNFCSFCIVPTTRGRETSRPLPEVVEEVRRLADQGYKEVQLLGQNVNSYRHDGADFADLLYAVHEVPGIECIRFITSHPKDCSDRLLEAMGTLPRMATNFHLPVQAGSNRVLRRMKRFYTKEHYLDLVAKFRERVPTGSLTTDIIVGFCDETDEDFEETYDLIQRARFDSAFIFYYSPREGTKSAQWMDSVPLEAKKRRLARALALQEQISGEINAQLVGTTQEVLIEGVSKRSESDLIGRTKADKCVIFAGDQSLIGQQRRVVVTESFPYTLLGNLTNE